MTVLGSGSYLKNITLQTLPIEDEVIVNRKFATLYMILCVIWYFMLLGKLSDDTSYE